MVVYMIFPFKPEIQFLYLLTKIIENTDSP